MINRVLNDIKTQEAGYFAEICPNYAAAILTGAGFMLPPWEMS